MASRIFGHIVDVSPGSKFDSRKALSKAGVHPPIAGICGSEKDGANSIVLSGAKGIYPTTGRQCLTRE